MPSRRDYIVLQAGEQLPPISEQLLTACLRLFAAGTHKSTGLSPEVEVCVVLDRAGADLMDNAAPGLREEIFATMKRVRDAVLREDAAPGA